MKKDIIQLEKEFRKNYTHDALRFKIKYLLSQLYKDKDILDEIQKIKDRLIKQKREYLRNFPDEANRIEQKIHDMSYEEFLTLENLYLIARGRSGHTMKGVHSVSIERIIKLKYPKIVELLELSRLKTNLYVIFVFDKFKELGIDSELSLIITDPQISYNDYLADYFDSINEKNPSMAQWIVKHWKDIHNKTK